MKKTTSVAAATLAALLVGAGGACLIQVAAKPAVYRLPPETARLKPGPNLETAQANCTGCHSADYIATQPRGPKFGEDFWKAEVAKMIKIYGAPIDQTDVPKLVEYLTKAYAETNAPDAPTPTPAKPTPDAKPSPSASR